MLGNLASAVDPDLAGRLREHGVPVLEGLRPGLLALGHLLAHADRTPEAPRPGRIRRRPDSPSAPPASRRARTPPQAPPSPPAPPADLAPSGHPSSRPAAAASVASATGPPSPPAAATGPRASPRAGGPRLALLREYGIATAAAAEAGDVGAALAAADAIGYPVVLKTADPDITHKSDARGVLLGIGGPPNSPAPKPTFPRGWVRECWCARACRRAPSSRSGSPATRTSAR